MAYRSVEDSGLGFSLKPPSWMRNAATSFIHVAQRVTGAAEQTQRVVGAATSASQPVALTAPAEPPLGGTPSWLIPAAVGLVALLVLPKVLRCR